MNWKAFVAIFVGFFVVVAATAGSAQERGQVRAQGRVIVKPEVEEEGLPKVEIDAAVDPREEMRKLVLAISTFARQHNRNFHIVTQNGLELLEKRRYTDDGVVTAPAQGYSQAISGVLQEGLFYGLPEIGKPTPDDRREALLPLLQTAKDRDLRVFVMDYGRDAALVRSSHRKIAELGYIPFIAPDRGTALNSLPGYARYPWAENSNSILSLPAVKNYLYIRDSSAFGLQEEFTLKLHDTNFDLVVVDVFHRPGEPFTRKSVDAMRFKKLGARRLVFAYLNIGQAMSYRYYWKPEWKAGSPQWIVAAKADDPDSYYIRYWHDDWQKIVTGNPDSYIYGIIAQGYDGVVLDGIEAYRLFDGSRGAPGATN